MMPVRKGGNFSKIQIPRMTTAAELQGPTPPAAPVQAHRVTDRTAPGKFLCSVWRTHFYSTIFAAPILIVMALSGLVIMYTEPITGLLYSKTTRVIVDGHLSLSLQARQVAAARSAPKGATLFRVVTPKEPDRVSEFYYPGPRPDPSCAPAAQQFRPSSPPRLTASRPSPPRSGCRLRLFGFLKSQSASRTRWVLDAQRDFLNEGRPGLCLGR